jgi:imidazolonepropionase-like amidohydrolase
MSSILFANAALFDGHSDTLIPDRHVLVEDGRIKEVSDAPLEARSARRIDVGGRTLMPGLIDAHYHAISADADVGAVENMPGSLIAQHARHLLEASVRRGFTTIRDAGGADYGLARAIAQGLIRGPRLFYSGRALSQTGGHGDQRSLEHDHALCACGMGARWFSRIADGVAAVRQAARDELRKGATQIKIMASGGVASPSDPIWVLQYSEEEMRAVVEEAAAWRTYVMAHAYTPEAISRGIRLGVRSIEHGNLIDAATAAQAAAAGAFVVPTLATYEALAVHGRDLGFPQRSLDKLEDVRSAGLAALEILTTAGVQIGFGTDLLGAMHRHQLSEFQIRARVMAPVDILRQATSVNARLLNREGELGVVKAGALADLLVLDGDPTRDAGVLAGEGERVLMVLRGGEVLKDT